MKVNLKYNKFNIHNCLRLGTEILGTSVSARTSTNTWPLQYSGHWLSHNIFKFVSSLVTIILSELRKIKGGTISNTFLSVISSQKCFVNPQWNDNIPLEVLHRWKAVNKSTPACFRVVVRIKLANLWKLLGPCFTCDCCLFFYLFIQHVHVK